MPDPRERTERLIADIWAICAPYGRGTKDDYRVALPPSLALEAADLLAAQERVMEAAREVRTGLGMTAYEGTPVSVWSAKHYEKMLGDALAALDRGDGK